MSTDDGRPADSLHDDDREPAEETGQDAGQEVTRPRRRHRRATGGTAPAGADEPVGGSVLPRSPDESGTGWGDEPDGNDERLRRDVPPHW